MIKSYGENTFEVLKNVNTLHGQISTTFLDYSPPRFEIEDTINGIDLHYISSRMGFTPFLEGLIEGISTLFSEKIVISSIESILVDEGQHQVLKLQKLDSSYNG